MVPEKEPETEPESEEPEMVAPVMVGLARVAPDGNLSILLESATILRSEE